MRKNIIRIRLIVALGIIALAARNVVFWAMGTGTQTEHLYLTRGIYLGLPAMVVGLLVFVSWTILGKPQEFRIPSAITLAGAASIAWPGFANLIFEVVNTVI